MFGFGNLLKDYLKFYNISQTDFALRLGISQKYMNEILNGNANISESLMLKINLITNIDLNLILLAENKKKIFNELNARFKSEKEMSAFLNKLCAKDRKYIHFKDENSIYQKALDLLNYLNVKSFDNLDK